MVPIVRLRDTKRTRLPSPTHAHKKKGGEKAGEQRMYSLEGNGTQGRPTRIGVVVLTKRGKKRKKKKSSGGLGSGAGERGGEKRQPLSVGLRKEKGRGNN